MKKHDFAKIFILCSLSVLFVSCQTLSGQPGIKKVEVIPEAIQTGESAIIRVAVRDKHRLIKYVEGVIKEDPRIKLRLRDDGVEPDEKANDGVWTLKVDVPDEAVAGKFTLEITAYRKDGSPLKVRDKKTGIVTLKEEVPVMIVKNR